MKLLQFLEATNPNVKVKKKGHIYHAYLKGKWVGQAMVSEYQDDNVGENERYVWKSAVDPTMTRQGIATEMYDVIAKDLESQGLKLVPSPDQQLSPEAYQFWKARDPESIKGHGTFKAEELQHFVGREIEVRGRPTVVTRVGWAKVSDAPLIGVRFTDVPEGSVNSTSQVRMADVQDQLTEAVEEKFGKSVIWDNGNFFIAVNNPDKPTFFTAWTQDNEKVATLSTKVMTKSGEPWMAVEYVEVDPSSQRQGIARALYHVMIDGMSPEYAGLFGYGPDIASQHVSKIYQRYGAYEQEDGHFYIPNPNRGVTEAEGDTLKLPDIDVGDELMVGKFKNRKATVKGFTKDKHNQPIAKTNKGDQQIFKGRVKKLMDEAVNLGELEDMRMAMYYASVAGDEVKKAMEKYPEYIDPFLEEFTGDHMISLEDLDDEQRAEFETWLERAIPDQAADALNRVIGNLETNDEYGGIVLYRYIVAPPNLPETFHTQPVGIYWSSNPNEAKAHWAHEKDGSVEWLITAVTSPDNINWVATIFQNTIEPHEAEIQVKKGAPITIIDLNPQTSPESAYGSEGMPGQGDVRYNFRNNNEEPLQLTASIGEEPK